MVRALIAERLGFLPAATCRHVTRRARVDPTIDRVVYVVRPARAVHTETPLSGQQACSTC